MSNEPSAIELCSAFLEMADRGALDAAVLEPILRTYFHANEHALWSDALRENDLV